MMNRKTLITAIAGMLTLSALSFAQPRGPRMQPGPQMDMPRMFNHMNRTLPEKLEMTPEQVEQFNALVEQQRSGHEEILTLIRRQQEQFKDGLDAILTPEQQEKLRDTRPRHGRGRAAPGCGKIGMCPEPGRMGFARGEPSQTPPPGFLFKAIKQLDLTDEQDAQIKAILETSKNRLKAEEGPDRETRRQMGREMKEQIEQILSPEQSEQLKAAMEKTRMGRPKGSGEDRPMGPKRFGPSEKEGPRESRGKKMI